MNKKCIIVSLFSKITPVIAGAFTNLGFDSPDLTHLDSFQQAPAGEAIRGWSLKLDNGVAYPTRIIVANELVSPVSLTTDHKIPGTDVDFGKYSLFMGGVGSSVTPIYHLSQIGLIPGDAGALRFYLSDAISGLPSTAVFQFLINGQRVGLKMAPGIRPDILDADVSVYAGQDVNLEFVFGKTFTRSFDIAGFTTVPEPSTYALLGFGAALLWYHRRHRPR